MLLYHIDGVRINDSWYAYDGEKWHAFFLEYGENEPPEGMWSRQRIGHCVSRDLIHWDYLGVALAPDKDTWNDVGIATGSVARCGDKWYMLYTGNSSDQSKRGLGLAVSDDLLSWERVGDGPVIERNRRVGIGGYTVQILADPYVYPEPVDGYYHIFVNSWVSHHRLGERGAQAVFVTKDFTSFEPRAIAASGFCDRMETAQVWRHGEKYYMYTGAVNVRDEIPPEDPPGTHLEWVDWKNAPQTNEILVADSIDGPYAPLCAIDFPEDEPHGFLYIAKTLHTGDGDVMLVNDVPAGARGIYSVIYRGDGTVGLENKYNGRT